MGSMYIFQDLEKIMDVVLMMTEKKARCINGDYRLCRHPQGTELKTLEHAKTRWKHLNLPLDAHHNSPMHFQTNMTQWPSHRQMQMPTCGLQQQGLKSLHKVCVANCSRWWRYIMSLVDLYHSVEIAYAHLSRYLGRKYILLRKDAFRAWSPIRLSSVIPLSTTQLDAEVSFVNVHYLNESGASWLFNSTLLA